jgi:hypothetical protein
VILAAARLLLRVEKARLEAGLYDRRRSLQLDRIILALEALA